MSDPSLLESAVRRILVYGVTGSGKTTLAAQISERTDLPWHEVDSLTWEPGWHSVDETEQRRRVSEICARDRWILDSAYSTWIEVVLARVELIVALDYSRWRSFARVTWRSIRRAADRQLVCNGNIETWRNFFSRNSMMCWHFRSFVRKRARMRAWDRDESGILIVRLRSPRATRRWLADLGTTPSLRSG